jgi:TetR/AcrR family transcriptional regulator
MSLNNNSIFSDNLCEGAISILNVAEELFSKHGFAAVSINKIAQEAKISKGNIFHHFQSKEGLYLAVLKHACKRSSSALELVNTYSSDDLLEVMRGFFSSHLTTLLSESRATQLIQRELMENGEQKGKQLAEEVFADTFSNLTRLVRDAQEHKIVRQSVDPSLLAFLLLGTNVIFFEARSMLKHLPDIDFAESPEDYSSGVFDILTNGFK